jgi:crossover junction endodeoxyribonuclease RuvC
VLGVDLGLGTTGLAVVSAKLEPPHNIWVDAVKPPGPSKAVLEERIDNIIQMILAYAGRVDLTVMEGPSYASKGSATVTLGMLHGAVRYALWKANRAFSVQSPATLKRFATGKGNATKEEMLEAAQVFYNTDSHDIADAIHAGRFGVENYEEIVE